MLSPQGPAMAWPLQYRPGPDAPGGRPGRDGGAFQSAVLCVCSEETLGGRDAGSLQGTDPAAYRIQSYKTGLLCCAHALALLREAGGPGARDRAPESTPPESRAHPTPKPCWPTGSLARMRQHGVGRCVCIYRAFGFGRSFAIASVASWACSGRCGPLRQVHGAFLRGWHRHLRDAGPLQPAPGHARSKTILL